MNRLWMVPVVGLLAAGCGGNDGSGLSATGTVQLTVHQSGQADGTSGFNLTSGTLVDPPPGVGSGFNGTCVRAGNRWTVDLARSDARTVGLTRMTLAVSSTGDGGANAPPTAAFTVDTSTFSAGGTCTGTASASGTSDVRITVQCTGLAATSDPRTVDAAVSLTLGGCTGS